MAKEVENTNVTEVTEVKEKLSLGQRVDIAKEKAAHFFNDTKLGKGLKTAGKIAVVGVLAVGAYCKGKGDGINETVEKYFVKDLTSEEPAEDYDEVFEEAVEDEEPSTEEEI